MQLVGEVIRLEPKLEFSDTALVDWLTAICDLALSTSSPTYKGFWIVPQQGPLAGERLARMESSANSFPGYPSLDKILRDNEQGTDVITVTQCADELAVVICNMKQIFDRSIGQLWAVTPTIGVREARRRLLDAGRYAENVMKMHKLADSAKILASANLMLPGTVEAAAGTTVRLANQALHSRFVVIWIIKEGTNILQSISITEAGYRSAAVSMRMGQGIAGRCAEERRAIRVDDFNDYKRLAPLGTPAPHHPRVLERQGIQSAQFLPMIQQGRLLGVIAAYYQRPFGATDIDEHILSLFAHEFGVCYEPLLKAEDSERFRRTIDDRAPLIETAIGVANQLHDLHDALMAAESLLGLISPKDTMELSRLRTISERVNFSRRIVSNAVEQGKIIRESANAPLPPQLTSSTLKNSPTIHRIGRQSVGNFLKEVADRYRQMADQNRTEITVDIIGEDQRLVFDSFQLGRAIGNLILNALQAVQRRGKKKIEIRAWVENCKINISVADTGPGMTEDVIPRIFDVFFSTRGGYGSGLGLPITKQIVESQRGTISVSSTFGAGSRFTIALPLPQSEG